MGGGGRVEGGVSRPKENIRNPFSRGSVGAAAEGFLNFLVKVQFCFPLIN